jgi:hypothetical protein
MRPVSRSAVPTLAAERQLLRGETAAEPNGSRISTFSRHPGSDLNWIVALRPLAAEEAALLYVLAGHGVGDVS